MWFTIGIIVVITLLIAFSVAAALIRNAKTPKGRLIALIAAATLGLCALGIMSLLGFMLR